MQTLIQEIPGAPSMDLLAETCHSLPGFAYLRTGLIDSPRARLSIIAAEPLIQFSSVGTECALRSGETQRQERGNPFRLLENLSERFQSHPDTSAADTAHPYPEGAMLGFWGYDLKNVLELGPSTTPTQKPAILQVPDCSVGVYGSLVVFDHSVRRTYLIATGFGPDGTRSRSRAQHDLDSWQRRLDAVANAFHPASFASPAPAPSVNSDALKSCMTRDEFIAKVLKAQQYIRAGDIYQVNLSRAWLAPCRSSWAFFKTLAARSPAPYSAYLSCGGFEIVSSSPEQFLHFAGPEVTTRPIKGTRPRHSDPAKDSALSQELLSSPKENAELLMITDLLRNDLGRVCDFGSIHVPELATLERFSHVQHLVSTVKGRLRKGMTHIAAMEACFPGGSITGAPKIRAMQIIDELEPVSRGPYTGALGYFGFNGQSQLNILIRTAVCIDGQASFQSGAGIVADSDPASEYLETQVKAQALLESISYNTTPKKPQV